MLVLPLIFVKIAHITCIIVIMATTDILERVRIMQVATPTPIIDRQRLHATLLPLLCLLMGSLCITCLILGSDLECLRQVNYFLLLLLCKLL